MKKKQFFKKRWISLFFAFSCSNVLKNFLKFSKKAPSVPNFGRFVPKILPPIPNLMRGKITKEMPRMGALPPKCAPLGVPQNFCRVCCSMGPQQLMFYSIFKKEFSEIFGWSCSIGPNIFWKKNCQKFDTFRNFFQKINVKCFKMVSNAKMFSINLK